MKKILIILSILPNLVFAQTHLKNQKFIDLSIGGYDGISSNNCSFQIGVGKYNKKINANAIEFTYANKLAKIAGNQNIDIPVEQVFVSLKRNFSIFRNYNNTFIISVFGNTNLGYEAINRNKGNTEAFELIDKSDYLLGLGFGPNLEFNNIHFGVSSNLNFISQYQKFSTFPYLKYRFHL